MSQSEGSAFDAPCKEALYRSIEERDKASKEAREANAKWIDLWGQIAVLRTQITEIEDDRRRLKAALCKWVQHYERSAPDDANPTDPEWTLWLESRQLLGASATNYRSR